MNSAPHGPPDASANPTMGGSLHLAAGLAIGLAMGVALVGALVYWTRPQQPKPWHGRVRDELAEQLRQLQKVAAAVAQEIERA